jgi:hypothetical protein
MMRTPGMACAALVVALSGCGPTDSGELKRRVETLDAIAVEGRLLADGVIGDRTRATFTRVHARTLAEDAQHEAEKIADAQVEPGLRREQERAVAIAQRLSDALGGLETFPGGEGNAIGTRDELAKVADQARRLDERIPE